MSNTVTLGVVQFACTDDVAQNLATASRLVRDAAGRGANVVLVQELFEGLYFCQEEDPSHFARARPSEGHATIAAFSALARELGIVIPVSFFERRNQAYFNAVAMVDDTGSVLGVYRKSHIPDGPGYEEKYYFTPGDTGFRVWQTRFGAIGVGICWDQWFPEAARAMALMGAEMLLYPTAIGSEPGRPDFDSMEHWRITMRGHAGANLMPVAAANRIGVEIVGGRVQTYYGSSFIAGASGELVAEAGRDGEAVLTARFDRAALARQRAAWGLFRDRRPELYSALATTDGG
ncbi:N-carbamoylputrescine amidase [Aquibium carbonis]|uniref:N-carbamoylputrescine amidase n=1 Tax=Aquibium carbonis TaxID=2495581 RepID=A0A3S0A441_9HYPH|nr:N-carbamoylputrescine amidase [Aquibium carbonis]RST84382.1 N-carbamoylputrescine amidase [Aquibium carbonis]